MISSLVRSLRFNYSLKFCQVVLQYTPHFSIVRVSGFSKNTEQEMTSNYIHVLLSRGSHSNRGRCPPGDGGLDPCPGEGRR